MTIDINIVNGNLFLPDGFRRGGISIEGDRIIKIGKEPSLPKASLKIDANGAIVLPGLIDIHVHLRDLKQKYKETLESGTRAAVAGGVTTVIDMPNNKPPTDSAQRLIKKKEIIREKAAANIGFYALVPSTKEEINSLARTGIFGYKIYPASPYYPPKDPLLLSSLAAAIVSKKLPMHIHPDNGYADDIEKRLFMGEMPKIDAFLKAHNQLEEAKALTEFIELTKTVKGKLHCCHVTAQETVEVLRKNRSQNGLTAEVCLHHLLLTENDLRRFKSEAKCLPPLRSNEDRQSLWEALNDGTIKIIATDHAPHSYKEKHCEFEAAACGISGLETLLPTMITSALKGWISLEKLIPLFTVNPARFAKIEGRGEIKKGYFADLVIIKKQKMKIKAENFESKAKWTPLNGFESLVVPSIVIVNGFLSKEDEYVLSRARAGRILERKTEAYEEKEE